MVRVTLSIGLAIVVTLVPLNALESLVGSSLWGAHVLAGVGAVSIILLFLRLMTGWIVWPTIIGAAVGLAVVAGIEGITGNPDLLRPFNAGLSPWWETAEVGVRILRTEVAPVTDGPGVGFVIASAAVLLFLAVEALAVGARSPVLAGLPVLLLWAPPVVMGVDVPPHLLVMTIGSFVAMLGVAGDWTRRLLPALPLVAAVTALTVLASMAITPWSLAVPSWFGPGASVDGVRMDLGLDIREDLVRGEPFTVMKYRGLRPNQLGPVHSHTMTDFDGTMWHPTEEGGWDETAQLFDASTAAMFDPDGASLEVEVIIDRLDQDRLFLPSAPRHAPTPHLYDPVDDEVYGEPGTDVHYSLSGPGLDPDPTVWHERSLVSAELPERDRFLTIPATSGRQDIIDLAEHITTDGHSPYEKAVAIQDHLRHGEGFRYTTNVPAPTTDDAVWDFLTDGQGYCVQFATAMVMLARAAGIPARLAVGFLPGEYTEFPDGSRGGTVSSEDAHAWPQLFLGEAGWTRFEPTPAVRSGAVPSFARGLPAAAEPAPTEAPATPESTPTEQPADPLPQPEPSTSDPRRADTTSGPWPTVVVLALLLGAAGVGVTTWRRRVRQHTQGVEGHWTTALAALRPLGLEVLPSHTPLQVLRNAQELDIPLSTDVLEGFTRLTHALMAARYEPVPPVVDEERLNEWLSLVGTRVDR